MAFDRDENDVFFYSHGLVSSGRVGNNLPKSNSHEKGILTLQILQTQKRRSEMNVVHTFTQLCRLVFFFVYQYMILNWEVCIV